jgi:hypothetical protein
MSRQDDLMALVQRVSRLERQNQRLRQALLSILILALLLATAGWFGARRSAANAEQAVRRVDKFDEITVGRINIAGPAGVNRLILAHEMPRAPFQGESLQRTVPPGMAGMIYCAPNGDEVGGIGVSGTEKSGHALITLDYRNTPLEAIGFATDYGPNGQGASLVVMDNPTGTVDVKKIKANDEAEVKRLQAMMIDRVTLGVEAHDASLVVKDRKGKRRIVIGVDANDKARIEVLDENGKEILRLPAKS